jgi:hypothetical protein
VFDDFIAAAEYLIAQNYTSSDFCCSRWLKWRFACRGGDDPTSRVDESRFTGRGRDGHVALPYLHLRVGYMITEQLRTARRCLNTSKAILRLHARHPLNWSQIMTTGSRTSSSLRQVARQAGNNPINCIDVSGHGAGKSVSATIPKPSH